MMAMMRMIYPAQCNQENISTDHKVILDIQKYKNRKKFGKKWTIVVTSCCLIIDATVKSQQKRKS